MSNHSRTGLVLVSYGNGGIAETDDGDHIDCSYRRSVGRPVCGDEVALEMQREGPAAVTRIEPRRNEFVRSDSRQRKQVIAANLDRVLVVIAPEPEPSRDLVERYLVAVHSLGITPILVVNKAERLDHYLEGKPSGSGGPLLRLDEYRGLGYEVLETSCKGEPGTAGLADLIENHTSILVGQSGVGKSSLVNRLLPDLELQTGELSRVTGKGTHTTTTTIMYRLPCGGRLIDSPGVWEYGLWRMERQELAAGFPDFHPHDMACRFNDCSHVMEPGCGVRAAVADARIREWRYQAYCRLLEQAVA
ncbi:MAG: ribosome small subunit-dependent GTPase A [Xanthomonadales bacterium]|nr:ribosome small subunit-dependent GTPase A [Gammaproteobacteria bacterium]MBT8051209.1 ribosome small subunit-dependent GTPase A [Gammaproteobacteria bacterium]NNJ78865.1 ribosome small subunit-dependent GTPase A [Xanthomonadales bacterium]NNL05379.1 ribosome small subunit-dependent GTPase A [Xanthomonadales bacterium]